MSREQPEPWLRGTRTGEEPVLAQVLYSFEQTVEDLEYFVSGLNADQVWARPHGLGSVGFHVQHILGSVDRLLTYAEGRSLSAEQLGRLSKESEGDRAGAELMAEVRRSLEGAGVRVKGFAGIDLASPRGVGRKAYPTTVGGLLVHLAEHTQRHLGQTITMAQLVSRSTS